LEYEPHDQRGECSGAKADNDKKHVKNVGIRFRQINP